MIASTSQEAYAKIQGKLGYKQKIVYETIKMLGSPTNEQLSDHLGWPINQITPRVFELRAYGLVGTEGRGVNKSGFSAKQWSIRDLNDRNLRLFEHDCAE